MLSEQIYRLRRRNGLSQEQLAGEIGVSRQAVSKWESGASIPELEKLSALSEYFQVPLDELVNGSVRIPEAGEQETPPLPEKKSAAFGIGVALCLMGGILLLAAGAALLFFPSAADRLNASSAVTLNGSGILFLLAAAAILAGMGFIFRKH